MQHCFQNVQTLHLYRSTVVSVFSVFGPNLPENYVHFVSVFGPDLTEEYISVSFFPVIPNEVAPLSTVLHWPEQLNVSNAGI